MPELFWSIPMKALIAMSGGVDSSVAAYFMKCRGYDCEGVTMRLFHNEDIGRSSHGTCCSEQDIEDASEVAFALDIPYSVLDYGEDFKDKIIEKFVRTYENGGTPNPCIDCNRHMKYDKLLRAAKERGADVIVTGHYARVEQDSRTGRYLLKKALDESKDQSYVLYMLTQEQLAHTVFPLGTMQKSEIRKIAEDEGFVTARKRDSQDICFVPDGDYAGFIEQYGGKKYPHGDFIDTKGNILGEHAGIVRYTVGQRKGLGVSSSERLYVTKIDPVDNTVTLSHGEELYTDKLKAGDINLISVMKIEQPMRVTAKLRYRQKEQPATAVQTDEDTLRIEFDEPQRAVTKGQAVVLYDGDTVVGGGTIK